MLSSRYLLVLLTLVIHASGRPLPIPIVRRAVNAGSAAEAPAEAPVAPAASAAPTAATGVVAVAASAPAPTSAASVADAASAAPTASMVAAVAATVADANNGDGDGDDDGDDDGDGGDGDGDGDDDDEVIISETFDENGFPVTTKKGSSHHHKVHHKPHKVSHKTITHQAATATHVTITNEPSSSTDDTVVETVFETSTIDPATLTDETIFGPSVAEPTPTMPLAAPALGAPTVTSDLPDLAVETQGVDRDIFKQSPELDFDTSSADDQISADPSDSGPALPLSTSLPSLDSTPLPVLSNDTLGMTAGVSAADNSSPIPAAFCVPQKNKKLTCTCVYADEEDEPENTGVRATVKADPQPAEEQPAAQQAPMEENTIEEIPTHHPGQYSSYGHYGVYPEAGKYHSYEEAAAPVGHNVVPAHHSAAPVQSAAPVHGAVPVAHNAVSSPPGHYGSYHSY